MDFINCKYCRGFDTLELIKDYEYQFQEDPIQIVDMYKCKICDTLHWEDEFEYHYQFYSRVEVDSNGHIGRWMDKTPSKTKEYELG